MTLWLSFGSSELGLVLPLVCVSHLSPATYWILQSLSLRYGNGRLSESYHACPYCLILAQFIVYAVSAVSWSPVSFHLAWMSAVVAWGLASSSYSSNL